MKIIEYSEDFGEICFDEGFEQKIYRKTIEEQIKHYRIRMKTTVEK